MTVPNARWRDLEPELPPTGVPLQYPHANADSGRAETDWSADARHTVLVPSSLSPPMLPWEAPTADTEDGGEPPPTAGTQSARWGRGPLVLAALGVAAIAVLALALIAQRPSGEPPPTPDAVTSGGPPLSPFEQSVQAWERKADRLEESLDEGSSRETIERQKYASADNLRTLLKEAADNRRSESSAEVKELVHSLEQLQDEVAQTNLPAGSKETSARKTDLEKLKLRRDKLSLKRDTLTYLDEDAKAELAALEEMEELADSWEIEQTTPPAGATLRRARGYLKSENATLRFLGAAALVRSPELADGAAVADQLDAPGYTESQLAKIVWWLVGSGEQALQERGVRRLQKSPRLFEQFDDLDALLQAVRQAPSTWQPVLPFLLEHCDDPDDVTHLLAAAVQQRNSACIPGIVKSCRDGALQSAAADVVRKVLAAGWREAYGPVVHEILKQQPQLPLTGLEHAWLVSLVRQGNDAETVRVLAAHLLAADDDTQRQWALDVFKFRDMLPAQEFRRRLANLQPAGRTAVLNYLLTNASDKTVAEAEWLLTGGLELAPNGITVEKLEAQLLARPSLKAALLNVVWRGSQEQKAWALTQQLGLPARQGFADLEKQLMGFKVWFTELQAWLNRGVVGPQGIFVLPVPPPAVAGHDFRGDLKDLSSRQKEVLEVVQRALKNQPPGAAAPLSTAGDALLSYLQQLDEQLRVCGKIVDAAHKPLTSRTQNLDRKQHQELAGYVQKFASQNVVLQELLTQVPWFAELPGQE